ncbi:MAG: hypothetical protein U9R04_01975 [Chloroflexota bacterium]|nr:hypothetical protein [Chloroflexota bacterium]
MLSFISRQIRKVVVYPVLRMLYVYWDLLRGKIRTRAHPSHKVKLRCIEKFQDEFNLPVFIETGTYLGHTVKAVKNNFQDIYSIELNDDLFVRANRMFSKFSHIHIIHGDSSRVLPELLPSICGECLFWLDAHYWGGVTGELALKSPVTQELGAIRNHPIKGHVILIDDARLFKGQDGWPALQEVFALLRRINPYYAVEVKDDIIRAYIKNGRHST